MDDLNTDTVGSQVAEPFEGLKKRYSRNRVWGAFSLILLPSILLTYGYVLVVLNNTGPKLAELPLEDRWDKLVETLFKPVPLFTFEQVADVSALFITTTAALLATVAAGYIAIAFSQSLAVGKLSRMLSRWAIVVCMAWLPVAILATVSLVALKEFLTPLFIAPLALALLWLSIHMAEFPVFSVDQRRTWLIKSLQQASKTRADVQERVNKIPSLGFAHLDHADPKNSTTKGQWKPRPRWLRIHICVLGIAWRGGTLASLAVLSMGINWSLFGWGGLRIFLQLFAPLWVTMLGALTLPFLRVAINTISDKWERRTAKSIITFLEFLLALLFLFGLVAAWSSGCEQTIACDPLFGSNLGPWLPSGVYLVLAVLVIWGGSWPGFTRIQKLTLEPAIWIATLERAIRAEDGVEKRLGDFSRAVEEQLDLTIREAVITQLIDGRRCSKKQLLAIITRKLPASLTFDEARTQAKCVFADLQGEKLIAPVHGAVGRQFKVRRYFQLGTAGQKFTQHHPAPEHLSQQPRIVGS